MSLDIESFPRINNIGLFKEKNKVKVVGFALSPNGTIRSLTIYPPHHRKDKFLKWIFKPHSNPYKIKNHFYLRFRNNDPALRRNILIKIFRHGYKKLVDKIVLSVMPHEEMSVKIPIGYLFDKGCLTAEKIYIKISSYPLIRRYAVYIPY